MEELKEIIVLLEGIKNHQLNYVQLARTTEPYKLADKALNIALSIHAVGKRSELLKTSLQEGEIVLLDDKLEVKVLTTDSQILILDSNTDKVVWVDKDRITRKSF